METKILIVDDSKTDVLIISNILRDYNLLTAEDGIEAMAVMQQHPDIALVILDLNMPRMNGFQVLEAMQSNPILSKIVVLVLTNYDEMENEIKGLELGAVDYIRKPLNIASLRKRIEVHLNLRNARRNIELQNEILEHTVAERTKELVITNDITIHALIGLLEVRNIESSNHTKRTQWMMKALCEILQQKATYADLLTDDYIMELFKTAPLHDIGKVGIPDRILLKPGKLDTDEFEIMKMHTTYGVDALRHESEEGVDLPSFIKTAIEIAGTHHERFDGTGYPYGLKAKEIPLSGRLMAIIDVYDAMMSKRVYKPAFTHGYTMEQIIGQSGKHFDPDLVDALVDIQNQFLSITKEFSQYAVEGE